MLRALFTSVAGMRNHMVRLDVIGNNIANVNTTGFKMGRVQFQDILNQTLINASAPTEDKGGKNAMQIGLGMSVASIDNIFSQGSIQLTRKETDLAIQGDGFFVVSDGAKQLYTRAGNFDVDSNGYFVHTPTGYRLQGWASAVEDGQVIIDRNKAVAALTTSGAADVSGRKLPAKATSNVNFRCNLNAGATVGTEHNTAITVFDDLGAEYLLQYTFKKMETVDLDNDGGDGTPAHYGPEHLSIAPGDANNLLFGAIDGANDTFTFYDPASPAPDRWAVPGHITVKRNGTTVTDFTTVPDANGDIVGIQMTTTPLVGDTITVNYREQLSQDDDGVADGQATAWTYQVSVMDVPLNVDSTDTDATDLGVQLEGPMGTTNLNGSGVLVFDNSTGRVNKALSALYNGTLPDDPDTGLPSLDITTFVDATTDYTKAITIEPEGGRAPNFDVGVVYDNVTQFDSAFTTAAETQDGYKMGELSRIFFSESGTITGVYTNGYKETLGQLALATFNNSAGLFKEGETMFTITTNSGLPVMGTPASGANGKIAPGTLEMSNVDLANEFTEMILTQRGFQANSRVITTADQILQELVQLKR